MATHDDRLRVNYGNGEPDAAPGSGARENGPQPAIRPPFDTALTADERRVTDFLDKWQPILRIKHWEIEIHWGTPPSDGCDASIWLSKQYPSARLFLDENWKDWDEVHFTRTIIHELLHIVMRDMDFVIVHLLEDQLHRDVDSMIRKAFLQAEEAAIEILSRAFTQLEFR